MLKLRTGECFHKSHQVIDLVISEVKGTDPTAQEIVDRITFLGYPAVIVVRNHVAKSFQTAIMHVRRGDGNVAQGGCLKGAEIVKAPGHGKTPQLRCLLVFQHLDVDFGECGLGVQKLPG